MADYEDDNSSLGLVVDERKDEFYAVKITGAPRETTVDDVRKFLNDCSVKEICFGVDDKGWTNGSIFVQLESQFDFENACLKDGHQLRWQKVGVLMITNKADYDRGRGGVSSFESPDIREDPIQRAQPVESHEEESYFIRLRGLPFSAMASDILDFLGDVAVRNGDKGVHFSFGFDGRVSGEAYVEVCSPEDISKALKHDREHLGGRYIEIFRASRAQFEWDCCGSEGSGGSGGVVRLRGLPYGCSKEDVRDFLQGIKIAENGITIQTNESGRETGEAFVELENEEDVERALDQHKKMMGHRYIEVFRTTFNDIRPVADRWARYSRPSPYPGRGGRGRGYSSPSDAHHRGAGYKFGGGASWRDYERDSQKSYSDGRYYDDSRYSGGRGGDGGVAYPSIRPSEYVSKYTEHTVRMRGLPFSATERDVFDFFSPLVPTKVSIDYDSYGRASGEGEVWFNSHEDAITAMKKDRSHIGSRYVELFLHSKSSPVQQYSSSQQSYYNNWSTSTTSSSNDQYGSYQSITPDPRTQHQSRPQSYSSYPHTQSTSYPAPVPYGTSSTGTMNYSTQQQQQYGQQGGGVYSGQTYNSTQHTTSSSSWY